MNKTRYDDDVEEEDSFSSESEELLHQKNMYDNERKYFCVICNKQFRSGKSYGGHVRIHSTVYGSKGKAKKMIKTPKKTVTSKEKEVDLTRADVAPGKIIRCFQCGKEFQTMHSLFRHLKIHPDDYDDVTEEVQEAARVLMTISWAYNMPNSEVRNSSFVKIITRV
ncbi:unnamed protein product [Cochlearia groenlandica]